MDYSLTIKCADFEQKSNINSNFEFNSKISEESPIYTFNDHTQATGLESNTNSNIHFNTITNSNPDLHITENSASDIPQLSIENISTDILSTECTVTLEDTVTSSNLQKNNINHSNSSMNSQSSFDTRRISIASELSSVKETCNSTVKNKQFMILSDVRHIIASNLEKVKRLEKENKDIPIMRKRLDHLETELMLRNLTPLYEDSTQTGKSDTSSTQYTPALLLTEIYTALNCQGAIENLTNNTIESEILNDNNNNINNNDNNNNNSNNNNINNNNNNNNILTSIRKIVLKRINQLKKLELKSSAIQHNTTDNLIKQISLLTSKSEEIDTKLINCRNYVNTVTSLKDEISRKENSYFKKYFEKLLSPNNKSKTSTSDQKIIELELKCKQFQIKLSQYRDTIMLDNTENETLAAQLQPYKAAAQTSIALYDEAKIVRSNLEAKETINAQLLNEINRLNEALETNAEMEYIENKKKIELLNNKNEEEIEILNQQLKESKNRSSNLSDSINKLTIMMSEHKHRNNELQTEVEDFKKNLETELDVKSNLDAEVTSLTKKLHHTENEYDKLLSSQQNIDLLNDNLRQAGQEICQHKKNNEQLFYDNTQLNSKVSDLVEKQEFLQQEVEDLKLENKASKDSVIILKSIESIFSESISKNENIIERIQNQQKSLTDNKELVEFLQAENAALTEKNLRDVTPSPTQSEENGEQLNHGEVKYLKDQLHKYRDEIKKNKKDKKDLEFKLNEMNLTREALLTTIDNLEEKLNSSNVNSNISSPLHSITSSDIENSVQFDFDFQQKFNFDRVTLENEISSLKDNFSKTEKENADLNEQITDLNSVIKAVEIELSKEKTDATKLLTEYSSLQGKANQNIAELESKKIEFANEKDFYVKNFTYELEIKNKEIDNLKKEISNGEAAMKKAFEVTEKFFPGGIPSQDLIDDANKRLQEHLNEEQEKIKRVHEENQKLEQQATLMENWLKEKDTKIDSLENQKVQFESDKQRYLQRLTRFEGIEYDNKQLKKELKENEAEIDRLRQKVNAKIIQI